MLGCHRDGMVNRSCPVRPWEVEKQRMSPAIVAMCGENPCPGAGWNDLFVHVSDLLGRGFDDPTINPR